MLGYVAILQGDNTAAVRALYECRGEAARTGNALARAYAVHRLGCLALLTGDMPRAERLLRAALGAYRELGEINSNVLMGQAELALSLVFQGDLDAAVALCADVREICEESGERWARSYALYVHAYAAWTRGRLGEARALLTEAVTIHHTFNDLVGLVLAMELMALVTADEGDPAEAAVLQGRPTGSGGRSGRPCSARRPSERRTNSANGGRRRCWGPSGTAPGWRRDAPCRRRVPSSAHWPGRPRGPYRRVSRRASADPSPRERRSAERTGRRESPPAPRPDRRGSGGLKRGRSRGVPAWDQRA